MFGTITAKAFRRAAALVAVLALLLAPPAQAAGTVTTTEVTHTSVKKLTFVWISTAGGVADGASTFAFDGQLIGLTTIPAAAGSAPTDDYDVTVTDADGHDVLLGAGANRDTANTEHVATGSLGGVAGSKLTVNVTNAGATKGGTVILRIR
jgi:hypothetical protein